MYQYFQQLKKLLLSITPNKYNPPQFVESEKENSVIETVSLQLTTLNKDNPPKFVESEKEKSVMKL